MMGKTRDTIPAGRKARSGFTMVELLVVIAIIGVLITLTVTVGRGVIEQGKVRQTMDILRALDALLTEYNTEYQSMPPYTADAKGATNPLRYIPPTGNSAQNTSAVFPESAVLIAQVQGMKGADSILAALPTESLMKRTELYAAAAKDGMTQYAGEITELPGVVPARTSVADAWGMEVLYIHPDNTVAVSGLSGGQFKGYGRASGDRPYFMSAGPDFKYDTLDDNVYSLDTIEKP